MLTPGANFLFCFVIFILQLSLCIQGRLVPGPPSNAKILRCSSPLYKMVWYLRITYVYPLHVSNHLQITYNT